MFLEFRLDQRVHELRDVAAHHRNLAHQRRGDERVLFLRRHEHRLDLRLQVAAHIRKLKLELKIRDRAQAPDDDGQSILQRKIDGQTVVAHDLHAWYVDEYPARHINALIEREHRGLVRIRGNCHDHALKDARGAAHQVVVPVRDRIEGARVDRGSLVVHGPDNTPWTKWYPTSPADFDFNTCQPAGSAGTPAARSFSRYTRAPSFSQLPDASCARYSGRTFCPKGGSRKARSN